VLAATIGWSGPRDGVSGPVLRYNGCRGTSETGDAHAMSTAAHHRPAHAMTVGDRVGWAPTPRSRRSYGGRGDGRAMTTLRATAYVLTSLASLVFLLLVAYAAVALHRWQAAFPALPG
jgi:hypothetical protein